jgi:hypothetical protein
MRQQYWVYGAIACFAGASACSHLVQRRLSASPQSPPLEVVSSAAPGKLPPPPRDYWQVKRDGKYLYCRQTVSTGSVLRREVCLTADELNREQSATRGILDARTKAQCGGSASCIFR